MAIAKNRSAGGSRKWVTLLLLIVLVLAAAIVWFRAPITGYSSAGAAYAARVGCSCRFVAGRDLESCETDRITGMELVTLVEDTDAKSVTARFPLIASATATYREGYGCVLERWEG
ncbi:hypothetical protein HME9302_02315 [Alteripontixanthobacter maritimus]|uniref:Uncharacterized protein n=1 Tax=Alteripontixanthobacter maritimus TaxID=2161824 RepID=A0A369QCY6_9SPHN|nr:hypothetical protein [Alteripontixanthobacter maritimus]RDC61096.1 hypothetical protein HME9302_02315 [Alteripontixanthobacter maritimus]